VDSEDQRYDRAHARVQALKGFYTHATAYVLVNIGLFVIDLLTGGDSRVERLRLRRGRALRPRLGGTQDQGADGQGPRSIARRGGW
jgi:hypothetical protein